MPWQMTKMPLISVRPVAQLVTRPPCAFGGSLMSNRPGRKACSNLRWYDAHGGSQDRRGRPSDQPGLDVTLQRARA
jgi:hypothetical protein